MTPLAPTDLARVELSGLTKVFSGVTVLDDVTATLHQGEIVGLVGENGAGKSTLLNILSGVFPASRGDVIINGAAVTVPNYRAANQLGLFRVYQDIALVESLTVEENLLLGWEQQIGGRLGLIDRRQRHDIAVRALETLELPARLAAATVSGLSVSVKQSLSFAKVLAAIDLLQVDRPVIFLDEPTTSLDKQSETRFLAVVRDLADRGATVVFVSHLLEEVLALTDRVLVLKDGQLVAERPTDGLTEEDLHRLMVGRVRSEVYYRENLQGEFAGQAQGPVPAFEIRDLSLRPDREPIEIDLAAGEIVGLAGLEGSGKNEIGALVAGVTRSQHAVTLDGAPIRYGSVRQAVQAGIVYLPQDRATSSLFAEKSLLFNLVIGSLHDLYGRRWGTVKQRLAAERSRRLLTEYAVKTTGLAQPIGELSGGNQQKVIIARWLHRKPRLIVLDSPTQGVDTGSRESIYEAIRAAAAQGSAVLLISDDLPELIGLSDRVLVVKDSQIAATIACPVGAKPQEDDVVPYMF